MKETTLKEYFENTTSAETLNQGVTGSQLRTGFDTSRLDVEIFLLILGGSFSQTAVTFHSNTKNAKQNIKQRSYT